MKAWELLGQSHTPDGAEMTLMLRDREYVILANGRSLMSSRMHGSEEALAALTSLRLRTRKQPSVLIGGLGMGFTLRAMLDRLPNNASVIVTELVAAVVDWNRGPLGHLAGHPLRDKRVRVEIGDVTTTLRSSVDRFDAVLLDVDNGPAAFTSSENAVLYANQGVAAARRALKPGGVLGIWSAWEDRKFEQRLHYHGFTVAVERVRGRLSKGGPRHTIFLGQRS